MELEFKGTKGSWSIEEKRASILDNTGKSLVCWYGVATSSFSEDEEELKANSKLLAAAPDLLDASQKAFDMCDKITMPTESQLIELKLILKKAIEKALK